MVYGSFCTRPSRVTRTHSLCVFVCEQADGHLLHVDFGYSFGNDPKPFPPPMKLTKEMVEGMGGVKSAEYKAFLSLCLQVRWRAWLNFVELVMLQYDCCDGVLCHFSKRCGEC